MLTIHISEEDLDRAIEKALQPIEDTKVGFKIFQSMKVRMDSYRHELGDEEVFYSGPYVFVGELFQILRTARVDFKTEANVLDIFAKELEKHSEESL